MLLIPLQSSPAQPGCTNCSPLPDSPGGQSLTLITQLANGTHNNLVCSSRGCEAAPGRELPRRGFPLKTPREKWDADWGGNGGGHQLEQINPTFHRELQKPPHLPLEDPLSPAICTAQNWEPHPILQEYMIE